MRILKKVIKKLYHLIWFLSIFIFFLPVVRAESYGGSLSADISSPFRAMAFDDYGNYWEPRQNSQYFFETGFNVSCQYGARTCGFSIETQQSYASGHYYGITLYLYYENTSYRIIPASGGARRIGMGNSMNAARINWVNNSNDVSQVIYTNYSYDNFTISLLNGTPFTGVYSVTYFFRTTTNNIGLAVPFNIDANVSSGTYYLVGYVLTDLGSADGLTESQVTNVIANSGLATANSIQEVQRGVNEVQQELSNLEQTEIQNTQDIINNQNENTNKTNETIEEQFNDCTSTYTLTQSNAKITGYYLRENSLFQYSTGMISDYLMVDPSTVYTIENSVAKYYPQVCQYDKEKTLINCISYNNRTTFAFTSATNTKYIRFSNSQFSNVSISGEKICSNRFDTLNNNLTDSSVDSSDFTINNLKNKIPTNSVISDLLLLPVRFLQNFVNALSSSCSSFSLGSLYGTELFIPCINIENYLGSGIWTTIDLIISGLFIYSLRKKFIEIYENLTNLRNGGNEVD